MTVTLAEVVERQALEPELTWVCLLALPLTSCVTSDRFHVLSKL